MGLAINLKGLPAARDLLYKIGTNLTPGKLRALSTNLGVIVQSDVMKNFEGEHTPEGAPWAPHSAVTTARRRVGRKRGAKYRNRILRDTGGMMSSVTVGGRILSPRVSVRENPAFFSSAEGAIRSASGSGFLIGSSLDRSAKHQFGDPGGTHYVENVEAHRVKRHAVKQHSVRAHTVKAHTRRTKSVGFLRALTINVPAHTVSDHSRGPYTVKAHDVRAHSRKAVTRRIPARPFLGVSGEGMRQVGEYSADYLLIAGA